MAKLLSNRYGDGLVYLRKPTNGVVLGDAIRQGLVTEDGYLTRKGRIFLARTRP